MPCSSTRCPGRPPYVLFPLTAGLPLMGSRSCCANPPSRQTHALDASSGSSAVTEAVMECRDRPPQCGGGRHIHRSSEGPWAKQHAPPPSTGPRHYTPFRVTPRAPLIELGENWLARGGGRGRCSPFPEPPPPPFWASADRDPRRADGDPQQADRGGGGGGGVLRYHNIYDSGEVLALRAHCVHIAHAEARILTQEYLSSV